ncbi:MAG: hypothetical protein GEU79_13660 [Acidimicrobiia bacterium]|nr:hypothetical protein [Acidimicrobiia bacterium]
MSFNKLKGSGPRQTRSEVVFPNPVTQASAIVRGFDVAFSPRNDHHLGQLEVRLDTTIDALAPRRVNVDVVYGLRDWSNNWDDNYEGEIHFTVIAE